MAVIASVGLCLAAGNRPAATVPDVMPEAAANVTAPAIMMTPALHAEASARLAAALRAESAELGSVTSAGSGPLSSGAEIVDEPVAPKLASLGQDIVQPLPAAARDASNDALKAASTQDFRYLVYYVWSELPPAEKPAEIVLRAFKDIPVGTPAEEIKRASDAFGLDFNFMMAVAKIESGFNPNQRTGSYIGLFQLSQYEFGKFGFGQIRNPRDNAVAAAYKIITEGVQFEWITHRTPDMSDLYLIHQSERTCNPSTTRSARGCHLCLRYDLLPMCPGWTCMIPALAYLVRSSPRVLSCRSALTSCFASRRRLLDSSERSFFSACRRVSRAGMSLTNCRIWRAST